MVEPYRSFMPVLTMLGEKRKGETEAQWHGRFDRLQERFGRVPELRNRLEEATKKRAQP